MEVHTLNLIDGFLTKLDAHSLWAGGTGGLAEIQTELDAAAPPTLAEDAVTAQSATSADSRPPVMLDYSGVSAIPPNPPHSRRVAEPSVPLDRQTFLDIGLEMLGDDIAFLRGVLPKASKPRNAIIREYIGRWRAGMSIEEVDFRKQNAGRRAGNLWVLELKKKREHQPLGGGFA